MAETSIEWTDRVWNPIAGCLIRSSGCSSCYAMKMARRCEAMGQVKYAGTTKLVNGKSVWTGRINLDEDSLTIPLGVRKPCRWFVNSMSDLFFGDEQDRIACERGGEPFKAVPFEFIDRVFAVMALTPQHTYQVLTKRPERMREYLGGERGHRTKCVSLAMRGFVPNWDDGDVAGSDQGRKWPLPNVWLGTSTENQKTSDDRIPHLLATPAAVRFVSAEPLLGPVDLGPWVGPWTCGGEAGVGVHDGKSGPGSYCGSICRDHGKPRGPLDWIIVGGESGHGARPCEIEWVRSIVRQCQAAGTKVFVKQLGANFVSTFEEWNDGERGEGVIGDDRSKITWGRRDIGSAKGGDPSFWPADLRIRETPATVEDAR